MSQNIVSVNSLSQLKGLPAYSKGVVVVEFFAPWSDISKQFVPVVEALATQYPAITIAKVDAEEVADISELFNVESVPTFVILVKGAIQDTLTGANPPELSKRIAAVAGTANSSKQDELSPQEELNARLRSIIDSSKVVLFMKGSPNAPKCGFSKQMVELLNSNGVVFSSFDILSDNSVREGLKVYSKWPTYPQLYANGKLVGGLDIAKELAAEGSLVESLSEHVSC